jgi:hypothetical protein
LTVNEREAAAPVFPAWSVARTWNVCGPSFKCASVLGDTHAANAPPSTLHRNVEPGSLDVKPNAGVGSFVVEPPGGPEVIDAPGGAESSV